MVENNKNTKLHFQTTVDKPNRKLFSNVLDRNSQNWHLKAVLEILIMSWGRSRMEGKNPTLSGGKMKRLIIPVCTGRPSPGEGSESHHLNFRLKQSTQSGINPSWEKVSYMWGQHSPGKNFLHQEGLAAQHLGWGCRNRRLGGRSKSRNSKSLNCQLACHVPWGT